jgi:2-polyprenyl-3-methyl-5-hydroxy-6-metoxy-1,4-benzoquinol methylase
VPESAQRVLDVGCGGGGLGAALKAERGCEVFGIEGFEDAAEEARGRLDGVLCLDLDGLDALPPDIGRFDAIVFGDVLEHLRDPARLVQTLLPALAEGGALVMSVPNVKHWSVFYPLLVDDRWTYEDVGLLDRTHVHFFTAHEIANMLGELGLEIAHLEVNDHAPLPPQMEPLAALAEFLRADRDEAAARLGAYQYLLVARRAAPGRTAPPIAEPATPFQAATREQLLTLVPDGAARVLELGCETTLDAPPAEEGPFDAIVLRHALEHVRDPAALLGALLPSLADDGVLVCSVPNVKHWSVLYPLLARDRWDYGDGGVLDRRHLHFFTLEELGDMLEALELDAVELISNDSEPLPEALAPFVDLAAAAGAEREETALRLGACEYLLVAKRRPAAAPGA